MSNSKPLVKSQLHKRNKNREPYDLNALRIAEPALETHLTINKYGNESVDFTNPKAVKLLNKALLNHYYGIKYWDFPPENLCPPIPGRADYIHHLADLLTESNAGILPIGNKINGLDIGVGASCIYPILGVTEYQWNFMGADINPKSIESSEKIIKQNSNLIGEIRCKLQKNAQSFFTGIIAPDEKFDFTMCNPPFHGSAEEAEHGSKRKVHNLTGRKIEKPILNFAGINSELIYEGGEFTFLKRMAEESLQFSKNCFWFTSLVSKESNLTGLIATLEKLDAVEIKKINMETGNKKVRMLAWTFLNKELQEFWRESRWKNVSL